MRRKTYDYNITDWQPPPSLPPSLSPSRPPFLPPVLSPSLPAHLLHIGKFAGGVGDEGVRDGIQDVLHAGVLGGRGGGRRVG